MVIARRAQVRSSTAVVAADLTEIARGDRVDILDSTTVEGEGWLRVRAHDAQNTEGWIEARYIMPQALLDHSRRLAEEDKNIPAQATGQLRASTNLRYSPDRTSPENILLKLESGAQFEIVGWKRVAKPKSSEQAESDDTPRSGTAQQNANRRRGNNDIPKPTEEEHELWYKVRLPSSISPAPAGWLYGKQVELTVPSDIVFYRTAREFVAWQRLDDVAGASQSVSGNRESGRDVQPGSWVILEKSSGTEPSQLEEPDFDRIFVLGYDKNRQEHYTAYRSPDVHGRLPLRVEGGPDGKFFAVRVESDGELKEVRFKVRRDDKGTLRVEAQGDLPRGGKRK